MKKLKDILAYCPYISKCECRDYESDDCRTYYEDCKMYLVFIKYERGDKNETIQKE